VSLLGGNQTQLKLQNKRLVLQSLYRLGRTTRVALAADTGLTKPTISSLVSELLAEGLVAEDGLGRSTGQGGKRPTLLRFRNAARQVIGLTVERGRASGVLADLSGRVSAQHELTVGPPGTVAALSAVASALLPQLDAELLGIALALPGRLDTATGTVVNSRALGLENVPLGADFEREYGVPVWLANYAELSALGQLAFGFEPGERPASLVTVALDDRVELGVSSRSGAEHYGSELAAPLLDGIGLGREALTELLSGSGPDACLLLRYRALKGDAEARAKLHDLAGRLSTLCAWVTLLIGPDRISFAGRVTDLGEEFIQLIRHGMEQHLGNSALPRLGAALTARLGALGATALILQKELGLLT